MMNIIIIGASGTIGTAVTKALSVEHEVITAGRSSGSLRVDISDPASVHRMFEAVGTVDGVISTAGDAVWKPFEEMSDDDYSVGLRSKLMGQINLVRFGRDTIRDNGSITLSTGILADHPVPQTTSAAMVNGGIHGFVKAAALELPRGIRVNAVCAGLVEDSADRFKEFFAGHTPVPMQEVVRAYKDCLEGDFTGQIVRVWPEQFGR